MKHEISNECLRNRKMSANKPRKVSKQNTRNNKTNSAEIKGATNNENNNTKNIVNHKIDIYKTVDEGMSSECAAELDLISSRKTKPDREDSQEPDQNIDASLSSNFEANNEISLHCLPTEMIEFVLHYLSPMDTLSCSSACQIWHTLLDNGTIWKSHCLRNKWKPLCDLCEPCSLNSDLGMGQFSLWKQCFLEHSRIRNNWMEGNSLQRTLQIDSTYTNVLSNSSVIVTWFFIQNIKIFKIIKHQVIEIQNFQPVLKRRPIVNVILNERKNAFVVIQYGLLQYYEEFERLETKDKKQTAPELFEYKSKVHNSEESLEHNTVKSKNQADKEHCDNEVEDNREIDIQTIFGLKFCKSFDVDERNIELSNKIINNEFQEWYERNVIRCNVNLNVKFNHGNLLYVCELERKILYVWNINTSQRKTVINLKQTIHKLYSKSNPTVLNFKLNKNKIFISIEISNTIYLILVFCQKTFQLIQQIKVKNSFHDFHVNEKYLVLDVMDNSRYLQIFDCNTFSVLNRKCKIIGDNEKLGNILLVDDEIMFHKENSVVIYDIKQKACSTYPTYNIGNITNIILAPFNLFILEYHMSDRKFVYCLYDRVTYRWVVKKFIMTFRRKPQILFLNLNSIIVKEFNQVHYFTFW